MFWRTYTAYGFGAVNYFNFTNIILNYLFFGFFALFPFALLGGGVAFGIALTPSRLTLRLGELAIA